MGYAALHREIILNQDDMIIDSDSKSTCTMKKRFDFYRTDDHVRFYANIIDHSLNFQINSFHSDTLEELWEMLETSMSQDIYRWQENTKLSDEVDDMKKFQRWNKVSRLAMPEEQRATGVRRIVFWRSFTIEYIWQQIFFNRSIEIYRQVEGQNTELVRCVVSKISA